MILVPVAVVKNTKIAVELTDKLKRWENPTVFYLFVII